jgi:outer membrane protein TolC
MRLLLVLLLTGGLTIAPGCASSPDRASGPASYNPPIVAVVGPPRNAPEETLAVANDEPVAMAGAGGEETPESGQSLAPLSQLGVIRQVSQVEVPPPAPAAEPDPFPPPPDMPAAVAEAVSLDEVITSVYQHYPLLQSALFQRNIAAGELLEASGAFDLKLKGASEHGPTAFYETYRNNVGLVQPLYCGGEAFAGYRIGRGSFEPWYRERQTNAGGEFKAGVAVPLWQDRTIDSRRAELWRASYERQLVEPEIQAQLIGYVQEAAYAYWDWVAAGARLQIADRVLQLADERTERIRRQVEQELLDPPELTDNNRLIAERRAKRADALRKLEVSAVKLSLYLRDPQGNPVVPPPAWLPEFPEPDPVRNEDLPVDIQVALQQRPEIAVIGFVQRQLDIDRAQAQNLYLPDVDAVISGSQDMGEPTSKKDDKDQFELEAGLYVEVPLQRRKALGKLQVVEGKLSQLHVKRRMVADKISAEVQAAYAGLAAAYEQYLQAKEAVELAEDLAQRERRSFELGASDLLKVTLREQYAAEAAEKTVEALLLYFRTRADYRASMAQDAAR